jgi:hypothetical protein
MSLPGPVHFQCWVCAKRYDIREHLANDSLVLPDCCRKTLAMLTSAMSKVLLSATMRKLKTEEAQDDRISAKLADLAVTSDDPELRSLAQRWRNRKQS